MEKEGGKDTRTKKQGSEKSEGLNKRNKEKKRREAREMGSKSFGQVNL